MKGPLRVAVVDDHPLFRDGVSRSLGETDGFLLSGEGRSAADAIEIAQVERPAIMLLDISIPGSGLVAAREIATRFPMIKVVMLTASEDNADVMTAFKSGVYGYILKGIGSSELCSILTAISEGDRYVPPKLGARLLREMEGRPDRDSPDPMAQLTRREDEILRIVALGLSNKEVAIRLNLQEKTVKHHMTRILSKLSVRNRTEAALMVRRKI